MRLNNHLGRYKVIAMELMLCTVTVAALVPRLEIILLGKNGAVGKTLLRNKVFALAGFFDEVNSHWPTAEEEIKTMTASFSREIKSSFSKNTNYLLVGKRGEPKTIKGAQTRQVEIINLQQLEQLLLGPSTIEAIHKLDRLTKSSFKGDAYKAEGDVSAASEGTPSNAGVMVTGVIGAMATAYGRGIERGKHRII